MGIGFGVDQLRVAADAIAGAPDSSLQHIAYIQLAADLPDLNRLVAVGERGRTRDHDHAGDSRQIGGQILSDAVCEVLLLRVVAQVGKGEHHDRESRYFGRVPDGCGESAARPRATSRGFGSQRVHPQRPPDVLDVLVSLALERVREPVLDLLSDNSGYADSARLR